jgi:hypothetical protein
VVVTCSSESGPALVRVCDYSDALGVGVACSFRQSLVSALVTADSTELNTTCPSARGVGESGGTLAVFTATLYAEPMPARVSCRVEPQL